MKTKKQKGESLQSIQSKLKKSTITIFTSFAQVGQKGLSVRDLKDLRMALRPLNSEYSVEKKTLLDKALKGEKKETDVFSYSGSLGVAYGYEDPYAVAKAVYQFGKKNPAFKFFGAFLGKDFLNADAFGELAKLPTKEVLIGRLVGMLSYPMRGLAVTLNQIAAKK